MPDAHVSPLQMIRQRFTTAYARLTDWQHHLTFAPVTAAVVRCLREPGQLAGQRVCLYVTHAPRGELYPRVPKQIRAWIDHGFRVIVIVALDDIHHFDPAPLPEDCEAVLLRENRGFDFAAWAAALRRWPLIRQAGLLTLTNDSLYGPFAGFAAMLDRVDASPDPLIGCTRSHAHGTHLQSYLLFFKPRVLLSNAFSRFWRQVRSAPVKHEAIRSYELRLSRYFEQYGFSTGVLFDISDAENSALSPSLLLWRKLIQMGFPFVKVQLLRDNPHGVRLNDWESVFHAQSGSTRDVWRDIERYRTETGRTYACASPARVNSRARFC